MKTIAGPREGFSKPSSANEHVGKRFECPECGATNEVETGDKVREVTLGNGGFQRPVVSQVEMPACPNCRRVATLKPWELQRPVEAFAKGVGRRR